MGDLIPPFFYMKKIKIEIDLSNKKILFDLASIGFLELFKYEDLLKEKDIRGQTVLYYYCVNINTFSIDTQNFILEKVINLKNLEIYNDIMGDTLLHVLAQRGRTEILKHPLFNTIKNNFSQTPYYFLIKHVANVKLKDCINLEEILKPLSYRKYLTPLMVLDAFLERSHKPSLKNLKDLGIPVIIENPRDIRRRVAYEDINNLKKNSPLMYIFS